MFEIFVLAWDIAGRTETDLQGGDAEMEEKFVIVFLYVLIMLVGRFLCLCSCICFRSYSGPEK